MTAKTPSVESLEPRLLYSADVFGLADVESVLPDETPVKPFGTDDGSTIELDYEVVHAGAVTVDDFDSEPNLDSWTLRELPSHGDFLLNGTPMDLDDVVSEGQVISGQLQYQHDGSNDLVDTSLFQHAFGGEDNDSWVRVNIDIAALNTSASLGIDVLNFTGSSTSVTTSNLLANDSDADGDILVISGFDQPTSGTLSLASEGVLRYTENAADSGQNLWHTSNITVRELDSSYILAAPLITTVDELTGSGSPSGSPSILHTDGSGIEHDPGTNGIDYGPLDLPDRFEISIEANANSVSAGDGNMLYSMGSANDIGSITVFTQQIGGDDYLIAHMGGGDIPDTTAELNSSDIVLFTQLDASYFTGWHDVRLSVDEDGIATLSLDGIVSDQMDVSGIDFQGSDFHVGNDTYLNSGVTIDRAFDGTLRNLYIRDLAGLGTSTPSVYESDSTLTLLRYVDTPSTAFADNYVLAADGTVSSATVGVNPLSDNDVYNTSGTVSHLWSLTSQANFGTATVHSDGSFSYSQTTATQTGDSFDYTLLSTYSGGSGSSWSVSTSGTVTLDASGVVVGTAPSAADDALSVLEGGSVSLTDAGDDSLFGNDVDTEGDDFELDWFTSPNHGALTLDNQGRFSYTHDGSENFSDSFTYTVIDDHGNVSNVATVSIDITPVNDNTPVVASDSVSIVLGGDQNTLDSGLTSLLDLATDADSGDVLTVSLIGHSSWIDVDVNSDGSFLVYDEVAYDQSDAQFIIRVTDAAGNSANSRIDVFISPNSPPVAVDDTLAVIEGATVAITTDGNSSLFDNDTDQNGQELSLISFTPPSHGTVSVNADGTFSYTHDGSENFSDQFSYTVQDALNATSASPATVSITITPDNENVPVAVADSLTVDFDQTASVLDGGASSLLANDTDDDAGDNMVASLITNPTKGTVTVNADGTFSYQHTAAAGSGADSFRYRVTDDAGQWSEVDVSVSIMANTSPAVSDDALTVDEGAAVSVTESGALSLLDNDSDPDGDALSVQGVTSPIHGTVSVAADGSFTYTHDGSENFSDEFRYTLVDEHGTVALTEGVVRITVNPVNDNVPTPNAETISIELGGTQSVLDSGAASVLDNDTDLDAGDSLSASLGNSPTGLSITLDPDGTFTLVDDTPFDNASTQFSYFVTDTAGNSVEQFVPIVIGPNYAPVAGDDALSVDEGGSVTSTDLGHLSLLDNDTDANNQVLSVQSTTQGLHGTVSVNADGSFVYTHDGSENFLDQFSYTVIDTALDSQADIGIVSVVINSLNENPPVAVDDHIQVEFGARQNQLVSGQLSLLHNDSDVDTGDTVTINGNSPPSKGNVNINPDGTFEYQHNGVESGADSFTYTVTDSAGNQSVATVFIEIDEEDKPPAFVGGDSEIQVHEGVSDTNDLSAYFVDEGDLTYEIRSGQQSFFDLNPNTGELKINASSADVGTHSVVVRVTDDSGQTAQRRFEIVVLANDTGGGTTTTSPPSEANGDNTSETDAETDDPIGTVEAKTEPEGAQQSESETSDNSAVVANELLSLWGQVGAANSADGRVEVDVDGLLGDVGGSGRESLMTAGAQQSVLRIGTTDGLSLSNLLDTTNQPETAALNDVTRGSQSTQTLSESANAITPVVTTATAATGFSIGYLLWLARSGFLLSTVLSALPAWRNVDPLPVLGSLSDTASNEDDPEDKSLSELTERD